MLKTKEMVRLSLVAVMLLTESIIFALFSYEACMLLSFNALSHFHGTGNSCVSFDVGKATSAKIIVTTADNNLAYLSNGSIGMCIYLTFID